MLKIEKVYKTVPERSSPILTDINLHLEAGDFCVVIGSNGSGKSSLLKLITGLYPATTGEIWLNKQQITNTSAYERAKWISLVTQDIQQGVIGEMTIFENIALSFTKNQQANLGFYSKFRSAATALLHEFNTKLSLDTLVKSLSGGEQQLIATLLAFTSKPQLLLLDEHTSALDPQMQERLMQYSSRKIVAEKLTTMMITHNLRDALQFGNKLILLSQGKIAQQFSGRSKAQLTIEQLTALMQI